MEQIILKSNQLINSAPINFFRSMSLQINWDERLIGILGARGVGKTTMLLQQAKTKYGLDPQALYINMEDIYLSGKSLRGVASDFRSKGGTHLFLDEIHNHPKWSSELKAIYDTLPDLKITFAGSSTIEMLKHYANLSQRATIYNLPTLSFREYLSMNNIAHLPCIDLPTVLSNHLDIAIELTSSFSPTLHFDRFLSRGSYPILSESFEQFKRELEKIILLTIELDMPYLDNYDSRNANKIKQLINIIAQNAPFKPNLVKISDTIGVHRNTLIGYFFHLEKAKLINLIYPSGANVSILQKPELVYLSNPNLINLLSHISPSRDNLTKSYLVNQLNPLYSIKLAKRDVIDVDGNWQLATGKGKKQVRKKMGEQPPHALIDGIEIGSDSRIPLWLIGLGY